MTHHDIEVHDLSKSFGKIAAVDGVGFTARSGRITGFLGPNGAGKTTTIRMMLGLVAPDRGSARFAGTGFTALPHPTRMVGVAIDSSGLQPSLTARDHLRVHAALGGHPSDRVDAVIQRLDLTAYAERRIRGFSSGMRQRLALATALLGDPGILVLDEPANGLDPHGIAWLRTFLRDFVGHGGTVLLASHMLSEVQRTVDDVVLIHGGRVLRSGSLESMTEGGSRTLEGAFLDLTLPGAPT